MPGRKRKGPTLDRGLCQRKETPRGRNPHLHERKNNLGKGEIASLLTVLVPTYGGCAKFRTMTSTIYVVDDDAPFRRSVIRLLRGARLSGARVRIGRRPTSRNDKLDDCLLVDHRIEYGKRVLDILSDRG